MSQHSRADYSPPNGLHTVPVTVSMGGLQKYVQWMRGCYSTSREKIDESSLALNPIYYPKSSILPNEVAKSLYSTSFTRVRI